MKWFIRIFISFGLIFFGGLSVLALYAEFGLPWKYNEKQRIMETYLKEKYKDSFTFEQVRFDLLHGRNYYAYATAQATGVSFYVEVSPENVVEDSYAYSYWNSEIKALFQPILQATLQEYEHLEGDVFLKQPMDVQTFNSDEATFDLFVTMGTPLADKKDEQIMRWFLAIEAIRAANFKLTQLTISYYDIEVSLNKAQLQQVHTAAQLEAFFSMDLIFQF